MTKQLLSSLILLGALPAAAAVDFSKYRDFQLGTGLPAIAKQTGDEASLTKVIHRRPALIQELDWHPRTVGPASGAEAVEDVRFSFYDGKLYRIAVRYDRYQTEGLTTDDLVQAISTTYGTAALSTPATIAADQGTFGDQETVIARWEDPEYRFELSRTSYGPSYKLTGVTKTVDAQATAAKIEARRLDDQEAPQRDAARIATEEESSKAKLEKARLVNKPKFRP